MNRWFRTGALLAALGVMIGAFGAHGLKATLTPDMLAVYETGARYHLLHALALLTLGVLPAERRRSIDRPAWCFVVGIGLFSGSLYMLAVTGIKALGAITPFGGLSFIVGWLWLALKGSAVEKDSSNP